MGDARAKGARLYTKKYVSIRYKQVSPQPSAFTRDITHNNAYHNSHINRASASNKKCNYMSRPDIFIKKQTLVEPRLLTLPSSALASRCSVNCHFPALP